MNLFTLFIAIAVVACLLSANAFNVPQMRPITRIQQKNLKMEYIPDGLTKAQWEAMKKKEIESNKGKNLGAIGITKFQSRSFEAWQKAGGKNLFPVDPNVPLAEKPYMQRPGGSADGTDLKKKGIFGIGQGVASARTSIDDKYDKLASEGKLRSSPFSLPWTNEDTSKLSKANSNKTAPLPQKAGGKTPPLPVKAPEEPKKKGFFGLF